MTGKETMPVSIGEICTDILIPIKRRASRSGEGLKALRWWSEVFGDDEPEVSGGDLAVLANELKERHHCFVGKYGILENGLTEIATGARKNLLGLAIFFDRREREKEYRLSVDEDMAIEVVKRKLYPLVRYDVDVWDSDGLGRVRYSRKPNWCTRVVVKIPVAESDDGRRERMKFEYRGLPEANFGFRKLADMLSLRFIKEGGSIRARVGNLIVDRQVGFYPLWLNHELGIGPEARAVFFSDKMEADRKLEMLRNVVTNPFTVCRREKLNSWFEIEAESWQVMEERIGNYARRSPDELTAELILRACPLL